MSKRKPSRTPKARAALTVKEAAEQAGLSPQEIVAAIESGELLAIDISGSPKRNLWRVPIGAFTRWKAQGRFRPSGNQTGGG